MDALIAFSGNGEHLAGALHIVIAMHLSCSVLLSELGMRSVVTFAASVMPLSRGTFVHRLAQYQLT